ncbi:hypothetical protein HPB50_021491 [Hyalomma asiaticum]|uniref:Uncharacterized protein n=1 Tax=Hyalomma asiaticum TaxID=266040 RepID=A0ACB7SK64_HYAAI|nr:hypothetical protein HPB50_021491 [Hyalomma asiaticum]
MRLFLEKFLDSMHKTGELVWKCSSGVVRSKITAICVCVDAPARAAVGNRLQFNGFFGCPWCLACGESEEGHPRTLTLIDRHLLSIRPPHHFTRLRRTLRERCYWKAHEAPYEAPLQNSTLQGNRIVDIDILS